MHPLIQLQAHPLACAAALAVQKVIAKENLLENCRAQGEYLAQQLHARLLAPTSPAAPFVFDIRGGGGFWTVEFDFSDAGEGAVPRVNFGGGQFAMLVQARCMREGLVIMGMVGNADVQGSKGDMCLLAPAYNIRREEVDRILELFVGSVEAVLGEALEG